MSHRDDGAWVFAYLADNQLRRNGEKQVWVWFPLDTVLNNVSNGREYLNWVDGRQAALTNYEEWDQYVRRISVPTPGRVKFLFIPFIYLLISSSRLGIGTTG